MVESQQRCEEAAKRRNTAIFGEGSWISICSYLRTLPPINDLSDMKAPLYMVEAPPTASDNLILCTVQHAGGKGGTRNHFTSEATVDTEYKENDAQKQAFLASWIWWLFM